MYSDEQLSEIKKQIFPRYFGQKLSDKSIHETFTCPLVFWNHTTSFVNGMTVLTAIDHKAILQLKSILSITDEDAIGVAKIFNEPCDLLQRGKDACISYLESQFTGGSYKWMLAIQYLELKGYALPHLVIIDEKPMTLSVEKQIELGIIELTK